MERFYLTAISLVVPLAVSASASAHIKMLKPTPWVTTDTLGNPQKVGPCGTANAGSAATNEVTTFTAGEEITVEWTETIDHPGHYRIALAKDRSELKDPDLDPPPGTCDYPAGSVPTEPHGNVLLDNLFPTTTSGGERSFSQKVKLPNEPCEKCTLQLVQWMTKHAPGCLYYQCADIRIVAADGAPKAGSAPAGGAGAKAPAAGSGGGASAGHDGDAGSEPADAEAETESDDGCTVRPGTRNDVWTASLLALAALAWSMRRRRR